MRLTAEEAEGQQRRVAGALAAAGVRAGDRIVVSVPSAAAVLPVVLGALRTGIVPVLLEPGLVAAERDRLVADADPALVVDSSAALAVLLDGRPAELAAVPLARPMHYTSGTTGWRKGVWSGDLEEVDARRLVDEEVELWGHGRGDIHLVCSPLHHSAPLRFAATTLLAGGTVVVPGRFDADLVRAALVEHRPTTTFVVPAHLQRLVGRGAGPLPDVGSLRLVAHAGAPCPEPLKRAALAAFPEGSVWEFYGSTEGQFTACPPEVWLARPGTVGPARPGRRLSTDVDGTIWCEVPDHARFEYWRDPVKTAAAWRGASFSVGDVGRLDDAGHLFLDGRRDDLVISGGVNVYPAEVERILSAVPGVVEVAVFGVSDVRWGQRVCAAVVGDTTEAAVLGAARALLSAPERPKQVVLVDELPRTAMGKVRRATLAADLGLSG